MINMLKRIIWGFSLAFLSVGLNAQQTSGFNLDAAIEYAWTNSTAIKNAQLNIVDAAEQIIERRAVGIPQITGTLNYQRYLKVPQQALPDAFVDFISALNPGEPVNREVSFFLRNNFSATANLDAVIFDGSYLTALKAARSYRRYVQEEFAVTRREVKNGVIDAYLPVLLLNENLKMLDDNISNLSGLFNETKALYKEGFAEQLDVDRLELSLANLEVEKENLSRQKEIAINILKFAMNYPATQDLTVDDNLSAFVELEQADLTDVINPQGRPEVILANSGVELNEMNVKVNKMGYYPTIRAFGTYAQNYQGNTTEDDFWAPQSLIGLTVNIPIFDGWDKKAKIQRARIATELSRNQQRDLERSIILEVTNARQAYQTALKSLQAQERNLQLAQRIYDTTQIKYREGVGSSLEVNQAEQALYTSQSNQIRAMYDLTVARFSLRKALGK